MSGGWKGLRGERHREAGDSGRCGEVRRGLHLLRGSARGQGRTAGRGHPGGMLPLVHAGRALRHAAQGAHDQRLRLRLLLLREPREQRRGAPSRLHASRAGRPHHRLLPPQLHRGAVPLLRCRRMPRPHHRAHDRGPAHPAGGVRLSRLHPHQGHPRHLGGAHRRAGAPVRPSLGEPGAAEPAEPGAFGPQQVAHVHPGPHAAYLRLHRRRRGIALAGEEAHYGIPDEEERPEGSGPSRRRASPPR